MVPKHKRLDAIRRIVQARAISTQQQLREALERRGFVADQATLSRDLAELGIRKVAGRYATVDSPGARRRAETIGSLASVVRGFAACGPHLVVIQTMVGRAQAVAVAIDSVEEPSIFATLAGDDTVFAATKNRRSQTVALRRLEHWFGEKHVKK